MFLFSWLSAKGSSEWTVCPLSHIPWSSWPFLSCCLITNSSSEWTVCLISHTPSSRCQFLLLSSSQTVHSSELYAMHRTCNYNLKCVCCLLRRKCFVSFLTVLLHHRLWLMHRKRFTSPCVHGWETLRGNCVQCISRKRCCKKPSKWYKTFALAETSNMIQIRVACAIRGI